MIESGPASQHTKEEPTLFHIIREQKRKLQRAVHSLTLENGETVTSREMLRAFRTHFSTKYDTIPHDATSTTFLTSQIDARIQAAAKDALAQPITMGELYYAVQEGKQHKAPGTEGIRYEFYKILWET
jgi:hypothetical protein